MAAAIGIATIATPTHTSKNFRGPLTASMASLPCKLTFDLPRSIEIEGSLMLASSEAPFDLLGARNPLAVEQSKKFQTCCRRGTVDEPKTRGYAKCAGAGAKAGMHEN